MSLARYADMSDPDSNPNFRRRWHEPNRPNKPLSLDRQADLLASVARHIAAEWLSHAATKLRREGGQ